MKNILTFRNDIQVILWLRELSGQLSDGFWENSTPYGHWKDWSRDVLVESGPDVGRNFYAQKTNYNFTNPELLDCVGKRMLGYARLASVFKLPTALEYAVAVECNGYNYPKHPGEYWDKKRALLDTFPLSVQLTINGGTEWNDKGVFSMKQLKVELNDMKKIIKQFKQTVLENIRNAEI